MAINPRNRKPLRTLMILGLLIAALFAGIASTVYLGPRTGQWTPKLALDLAGGHEMVLKARVEGKNAPSKEQLAQAVSIIRKRVDATGVAEAQVTTLGSDKVVVSLPGTPSETVLDSLKKSSQMRFRAVLMAGNGAGQATPAQSTMFSQVGELLGLPKPAAETPAGQPTATGTPGATATATATVTGTAKPSATGTATPSGSPTTANAVVPAADDTVSPTASSSAPAASTAATAPATKSPAATATPADPAAAPQTPTAVPNLMTTSKIQNDIATIWNGTAAKPKAGKGKELNPSSSAWISPALFQFFANVSCNSAQDREFVGALFTAADQPMVACSNDGSQKFLLGPSEVAGSSITDASSGYASNGNVTTNQIAVSLTLDDAGTKGFGNTTQRLFQLKQDPTFLEKLGLDEAQQQEWMTGMGDPMAQQYLQYIAPDAQTRNRFAMVLDGEVIQAPGVQSAITDGRAQISGGFTPETGKLLANQLKFGALPLSFAPDMQRQISPQLGGDQLRWGLVAGLIGFLFVVAFLLFQYRALGLVTVASLLVSAVITYGTVVLLGHLQNFRLSMAGITGLIVAIGVTADSFIVYFERVRDELRDGRTLRRAVDAGWDRAKRTILISGAVNVLAAVVLYLLSESNVKAFAYTFGITSIFDVLIVFLFTHPMLSILANKKFFAEGHPWSGFSRDQLGARAVTYAGRGRVTIADRKAAAQEGQL